MTIEPPIALTRWDIESLGRHSRGGAGSRAGQPCARYAEGFGGGGDAPGFAESDLLA